MVRDVWRGMSVDSCDEMSIDKSADRWMDGWMDG